MSKSYISPVIKNLPPSGIRKFFDIASHLEDVVSLGVGEPDFDTPWNITYEGIYALEKGKTHYTSNAGIFLLREEISHYMKRTLDLNYDPDNQILVTVGASEAIDIAMRTVITPGKNEEVLVVEPCFVSYKPCVIMAGGIPVPIATSEENEFRLTAADLLSKITQNTKAIIMSYPNNPTGAVMEYDDLKEIADVLKDRDIIVISDEIYSELSYGVKHTSIAQFVNMYDKTIIINGFSKAFAMTGWRLGYVVGAPDIIEQMTKIHQYIIMSAPTHSQYAAIAALKIGDSDVCNMRLEYEARRNVMLDGFRNMGLNCFKPKGAFYVFPSIKNTGLSSEQFCQRLLAEQNVVVVPGNSFGESGEGNIRCSYAYSIEDIKFALDKIKKFVDIL